MKVVLKQNMPKLGEIGTIVKVKDGYARNYLIPQGYALPYNDKTKKMVDNMIKLQQDKVRRKEKFYQDMINKIKATAVVIKKKAGENGKLFGSVTLQDIADAFKEQEIEVERKYIVLNHRINTLGEYDALVKYAQGFEAPFKVVVENEE